MELGTRLCVPPHVISRSVGDETVLLDLQTGLYFGLDAVGRRIWDLAGEGRTLGEIIDSIVSEFEVEPAEAQGDILSFAGILLERGLLVK